MLRALVILLMLLACAHAQAVHPIITHHHPRSYDALKAQVRSRLTQFLAKTIVSPSLPRNGKPTAVVPETPTVEPKRQH